jgi:hypothetical protein
MPHHAHSIVGTTPLGRTSTSTLPGSTTSFWRGRLSRPPSNAGLTQIHAAERGEDHREDLAGGRLTRCC